MEAVITFLYTVGDIIIAAVAGAEAVGTVGAITSAIIGATAIIGGTVGLSKLFEIELNTPDTDYARQRTVKGTTVPVKIVYGEALVSGPIAFVGAGNDAGSSGNDSLFHVVALTGHEVEDITDVYFDNVRIPNADIASGSSSGGAVAGNTVYGQVGGQTITWINKHFGDDTTSDAMIDNAFTKWTADHKGQGIAYLATQFYFPDDEDIAEIWNKYTPNDIKGLVKGVKTIYDPRNDTGGNGNNPAAFQSWSDNPALCLANYLTDQDFGMGIATNKIDWDSVADAADHCDETVTDPSGTPKRYTCNGVLYGTETHANNVSKLLSAMNGSLVYSNGVFVMNAGERLAPTVSLTENDLAGHVTITTASKRSERFNTITGLFNDPDQNHKQVEFPKVQVASAYQRDNNEELSKQIQLSFTNDIYMAQRLAYQMINRTNNQMVMDFPTNLRGLKVAVGDRVQITLNDIAGPDGDTISFINKVFICQNFSFSDSANGNVNLTLVEDYDGVNDYYADMPSNAYATVNLQDGTITDGFSGLQAPTSITATGVSQGIALNWTNPPAMDFSTKIKIYRDPTNNSTFNLANVDQIYQTRTDFYNIFDVPATTQYSFWFQTIRGSETSSTAGPYSATAGGITADSIEWSAVDNKVLGLGFTGDTLSISDATTGTVTGHDVAESGIKQEIEIDSGGIIMNAGGVIKSLNRASESDTNNAGFWLGWNAAANSGSGSYTFGVGDATDYLKYIDGTLTVSGAISATSGTIANTVTIGGTQASVVESGANAGSTALQDADTGVNLGLDDGSIGGITITSTSIESSNFVSGSAGFKLSSDGTFETGDGTFRGTVNATSGTFTGSIAAGSGTSVTIVGDASYPIYSGDVYEGNSASNDPDPLAASFRVSSDGTVFAKKIDIRDSDGNPLLSSADGIGAALLSQISLSSGAGVDSVSGTTSGDAGSFALTTTSSSVALVISTKVAIKDNSIGTLALTGQDSTEALAKERLIGGANYNGAKIRISFEVDGSVTDTHDITFVDYDNLGAGEPTSTQIAVNANYVGGSFNKYLTSLMDVGGAIEYIANTGYTGAYGATAYALVTNKTLTSVSAGSHTVKIKFALLDKVTNSAITSTTYTGTGIYYTGQTSGTLGNGQARRLYELTDANTINFLESAANTFSEAGSSVLTSGGTVSGDLVVSGNLTVQGDTITANVGTLDVEDKNITLNYSTGDSSATANGAGITIQDAVNSTTDATILWDGTNDEFDFSHGATFAGTVSSGNITTSGWMSFGIPGAGQSTTGRFISIEGNADTGGEGSSRIFFAEHNSTTGSMSNYGMSLGYRGGATSIVGADGNTWTGLSQIDNGEWGMWGHNNDATGVPIMSGDRAATVVRIHTALHLQKTGTATSGTTAYNSETLQFTASGWDTNGGVARDVSWKIRSIPTASIYPDHDLTFIESDQGNEYSKFILHGRGSTDYTDPLAASFYGNVNINAGTGTTAGSGDLAVAGNIQAPGIKATTYLWATGTVGSWPIYIDATSSWSSGTLNLPGIVWREADGTVRAGMRAYVGSSDESYLGLGTGFFNEQLTIKETGITVAGTVIGGSGSPTGSVIGNVRSYGTTSAYMSAGDESGRTAFFGVDSSGYAMFGALTNHDTMIRANNQEKLRIKTNSNVDIISGALEVGGTTVIDSNRNITAGTRITVTGGTAIEDAISTTNGRMRLGHHQSGAGIWFDTASVDQYWFVGLAGNNFRLYQGGDKFTLNSSGNLTITGTFQSGSTLNIAAGALQLGGTTVIDSNRNVTAVGLTSSTLKLGQTSQSLENFTTAADWAKPAGYSSMLRGTNQNASVVGTPVSANYWLYNVFAKRDTAGGTAGLLLNYDNGDFYTGFWSTSSTTPSWKKVAHEGGSPSFSSLTTTGNVTADNFVTNGGFQVQDGSAAGYGAFNNWVQLQGTGFYTTTNIHIDLDDSDAAFSVREEGNTEIFKVSTPSNTTQAVALVGGTLTALSNGGGIAIGGTTNPYISFHDNSGTARNGYIQKIYSSDEFYFGEVAKIRTAGYFESDVATGTAPLVVDSTTLVSNLNADLLDGQQGVYYDQRRYTSTSNYLGGYYVSGGSEKPNNTIFGAGKLKIAMLSGTNLGFGGTWNDVLWMSTYTGGDVKPSYAIVGNKYSDAMYFARQNYDSASWGTGHRIFADNYHPNADAWTTSRTITLGGDLSGSVSINGSADVTLTATVADDSHNHTIANVDSLQSTLDAKVDHIVTDSDITARMDSGFYQDGGSATTAEGWPETTNTWYHLIANTHSNTSNYYSQQFAADFFSTKLYYRSTNNSGTTPWQRVFMDNYHPNADAWTTGRTLSIGGTGKTVDGSGNVTWSTTEIGITKANIDALNVDADTLDGINSTSFLRSDVDDSYTGNLELAASSTSSVYSVAALEIRESNRTATTAATQPKISFHWGGVVASQLGMDTSGTLEVLNNPGTGYEAIRASGFIIADGGTFYSDASGRIATTADFYVRPESGNTYLYSTNTYLGDSTGDNIYCRGNTISGNGWSMTGAGVLSANNATFDAGTSTTVTVLCDDAGEAVIRAIGGNQGTGRLLVGQSAGYAGGIEYNGDGTPTGSGSGNDYITLFRVANSVYSWTARNFYNDNNWAFRGNVTAYASDERLKTNIKIIERPLEKLRTLRGVEFDWRDDVEEKGFMPAAKHETGVIAQDVQAVIPDAAVPAPFDENYLTVQHEKIIPLLIESVKELTAKVEELEKKLKEK